MVPTTHGGSMSTRNKALTGLTTAALLIAGVAWAADVPGTTITDRTVVPVDGAGTITLELVSAGLSMVEAVPEDGWTVTVETSVGREVEARFDSGTDSVDFNAELEDGEITVEIERSVTGSSSTSTSIDSSTSTTIDDSTGTSTTVDSSSTSTTIDDDDVLDLPDGPRTFEVGSGGAVTVGISGGRLSLVSVAANSGWSYEVDKAEPDDVRVEFEK